MSEQLVLAMLKGRPMSPSCLPKIDVTFEIIIKSKSNSDLLQI
jgi:hypothetical protein